MSLKKPDHSEPCEQAEVVYNKPLSGEFEEVLFGSDHGNTLWIRFSDKDGISEWIGKFGCGSSSAAHVMKAIAPDKFLVSAGGFAYLIDATARKLLSEHCEPFVQDAAYDSQKNLLIVAQNYHLRFLESGKEIWVSERIGVDGIRDLSVEGRVLSGLAATDYDGVEKRFRFDLDTRKILGWEKLPSNNPFKKKPWWKFW